MEQSSKNLTTQLAFVMAAFAVVLPMLSLAALGTIWLWENSLILWWAAIATIVSLLIYGAEWWLVRHGEKKAEPLSEATEEEFVVTSDGTKTPMRERAAWRAVDALLSKVSAENLADRDAVLELGKRTVETVAREMHPDVKDPTLKFTVPEALALIEQVSRRLNQFVDRRIPLKNRITVGHLMFAYRWRGLVGMAEKAYNLWRILRFANPAAAVAAEMRERVSGEMIRNAKSEVLKRIAQAYATEVARAAVDLYSGRLKFPATVSKDQRGSNDIAPGEAAR